MGLHAGLLFQTVARCQLVPVQLKFLQLLEAVHPVDGFQRIPRQIYTPQLWKLHTGQTAELVRQKQPRTGANPFALALSLRQC